MKRNRNRILSVLLTLVIASMLLPTSAHAVNDITLTISANVSTVEVGGTVTFTLNLSGIAAEDKMNGIGFKIVLPSGLTLDQVQPQLMADLPPRGQLSLRNLMKRRVLCSAL